MNAAWAVLLAVQLVTVASCDAQYINLRPASSEGALDTGGGGDVADAGAIDLAGDAGIDAIRDDGSAPDARPDASDDPGTLVDTVLRAGAFEGRTGYAASGTVEIVALAGGGLEVRLSPEFSSQAVPGPVVVLSDRDALGTALDVGADTVVSTLSSASGAQTYAVAPADEDAAREAAWVWIYCQPFGVEVARASLEATP